MTYAVSTRMRLWGLARVKNEGDIIEEFVRHNLEFLDGLTVVDNNSFDGTAEILEALTAEGLALRVLHDDRLAVRQSVAMTPLVREALADDWSFLFLLDGDEFIAAPDRTALESCLARLPAGHGGLLPWRTYLPARTFDRHVGVLQQMTERLVREPHAPLKAIVSRSIVERGGFTVIDGNHDVHDELGTGVSQRLDRADIVLAHYPVRNAAQLQGKMIMGWGRRLVMGYDEEGYGWHQRRIFQRLESEVIAEDELRELTKIYILRPEDGTDMPPTILDPIATHALRRYGDKSLPSAVQTAAGYVRQLAKALAARRTEPEA